MAKKILNADIDIIGPLVLGTADNEAGDFLTRGTGNTIKKRTSAEVLTDIGAAPTTHIHNYVHDQSTPSASWAVNHGLSKRVAIEVVDTAGTVVVGKIDYVDDNNLTLTFNAAFSGYAYCN